MADVKRYRALTSPGQRTFPTGNEIPRCGTLKFELVKRLLASLTPRSGEIQTQFEGGGEHDQEGKEGTHRGNHRTTNLTSAAKTQQAGETKKHPVRRRRARRVATQTR